MKLGKFVINIFLVGVFSFSLYKVSDKYISYKKADDIYLELQEIKDNLIEGNTEGKDGYSTENGEKILDLSYINEDYCGWITINNTNIDYPILQGIDNEYYLRKDINKEILASGSIFLDYRNSGFRDKNTIIYGHNMKNSTMFSQLGYFKEKDFFEKNRYIQIISPQGETLRYKIFSVYTTDANDNYLKTSFESHDDYKEFLDIIEAKSLFSSSIEVSTEDKIITLSTCSYEYEDARTVVHGKLLVQ